MSSIETPMDAFYAQKQYFSYSSLKTLIWSPTQFKKKYIDKIQEDKMEKHLIEGKVIHCMLLNNDSFEEQFIISPVNLPTGNTKLVVDRVYQHHTELLAADHTYAKNSLEEYESVIINVLEDIHLHQSLKTDSQRIAKICTEEAINYFDYLCIKSNRDVIDQETYDRCAAAAALFSSHPIISELLGMNSELDPDVEIYNETSLKIDLSNFNFGLKGIIDNYVVNHRQKKIFINDIKTSSKGLQDFANSVEYYQYWLQVIIYVSLITVKYKELLSNGYKIEFRFIVIDVNQQVYPFLVTEETLITWVTKLNSILETADYHYSNKDYNLPFEYAKNLVTL